MNPPSDALAARLQNRLKVRHYALLVAIDRHRSITKVAHSMALSQPTVTRALADIEDIFMTPLFVRTGRGLEPTPAGEIVVARARFAMADADAMRRELDGLRDGRQGRLRVGFIPYASGTALNVACSYLFTLQPRVALLAHEDTTLNLIAGLRNRTLDCAVCRFSQDSTADDLEQTLLYQERTHLVVSLPSAAMVTRRRTLDIAQLSELDWIFPPSGTPVRQLIDATFAAAGHQVPIPVLEAYAIRTVAHALANLPRGITVLPYGVAQTVAETGAAKVLPQPLPWSLPPVGIAWLRGAPKAALAGALAAVLRHALANPPNLSNVPASRV